MGGLLSVNPDKGGREVGKWMHLVRWWGWCYWWEPKIGDSLKSWISFCIIFFFSFLRNCLVSVSTKTGMEILPTYFFFLGFKKNVMGWGPSAYFGKLLELHILEIALRVVITDSSGIHI